MKQLHRVFTFAITTNEDGPLTLLFADLDNDTSIWSTETMLEIASNELFLKMMAKGAAIIRVDNGDGIPQLVATTDVGEYAINRLSVANKDEHVILYSPDKGVYTLNLQEVYYKCMLPHKIIMGCENCKATTNTCEIKKIELDYYGDEDSWTPEDAKEQLENRKSQLAGFTYISPKLTTPAIDWENKKECFGQLYRTPSHHDFSRIDDMSEFVASGLRERGRAKRFTKKACSQCLITEKCEYNRGCTGPYTDTEKTATDRIISKCKIPFTHKQLLYLLVNSGLLYERVNRRKTWTTFKLDSGPPYGQDHVLQYGFMRETQEDFQPFRSFNAAKNAIEAYDTPVIPDDHTPKLTRKDIAILLELAARTQSPRYCTWGYHSYCTIGIRYDTHAHKFRMYFRDPCTWGGSVLYTKVRAKSLQDIFSAYQGFKFLEKSYHSQRGTYRY